MKKEINKAFIGFSDLLYLPLEWLNVFELITPRVGEERDAWNTLRGKFAP